MAGYVIGVGFLLFAVWQLWLHRTPPGATVFTGQVIEEVHVTSTRTGRRSRMYAPRVAYQHPRTGRDEVYEPSEFGQARFRAGERTTLVYDPARERVLRPLDRPVRETLVLSLVGIGFVVAQALSG